MSMSPPKDWDAFGTAHRASANRTFVDLRPLTSPVMPAVLPGLLHYYYETHPDGSFTIGSYALTCRSERIVGCDSIDRYIRLDDRLAQPGIHYLLYVEDVGGDEWNLRVGTVPPGSGTPYTHPVAKPRTVGEILGGRMPVLPPPRSVDPGRFPHSCPRCSGPAYVGFLEVDCQRGCR